MVPGRTRLVGAVMVGGVGLVIANADVEGVALTAPASGRTHALSIRARVALSARRPRDAALISPLLARAGLLSWPKLGPNSTTVKASRRIRNGRLIDSLRRRLSRPSVTWAELVSHAWRPVAAPRRCGGRGAPGRAGQPRAGGQSP